MADEMLRIAGRGFDGRAKAIKTDDEGRLNTANDINSTKKTVYKKLDDTVIEPNSDLDFDILGEYEDATVLIRSTVSKLNLKIVLDHFHTEGGSDHIIQQVLLSQENIKTTPVNSSSGNIAYIHSLKLRLLGNRLRIRLQNRTENQITLSKVFGYVYNSMSGGGSSVLAAVDKNGEDSFFTVEKDPAGDTALRIVDAAPWAYDKEYDAIKVIEEVKNNHLLYSTGGLSVINGERLTIDDTWDISDFQKIRLTARTSPDSSFEFELIYASEYSSWIYSDKKTSAGGGHSEVFDVKSGEIRSIRITNNGSSPSDIIAFEMRGLK